MRAAHKATAVAKQRVRKPRGNGGSGRPGSPLKNTFGTDNQLYNILALVVAVLLAMLMIALLGAFWSGKHEIFLEYAKPILALLASIIAFIAGTTKRAR